MKSIDKAIDLLNQAKSAVQIAGLLYWREERAAEFDKAADAEIAIIMAIDEIKPLATKEAD